MVRQSVRLILGTRRGISLVIRNLLVAFGALSGILQLILALWARLNIDNHDRWLALLFMLGGSVVFGLAKSWPRHVISRTFTGPDVTVTVRVGDLFDQPTHLVIGMTDVFDTDMTDDVVISRESVQGQFQTRIYADQRARLDHDLAGALAGSVVEMTEPAESKPHGKRDRFPIGTVAVLGEPGRHFFCAAYSRMNNNLIATSTVDDLWRCLGSVWETVFIHAQRKTISIPIVGSELARISCINRESILKMILLSFMARSRQSLVSKELVVVIHPKDLHHINMLEVGAFVKSL